MICNILYFHSQPGCIVGYNVDCNAGNDIYSMSQKYVNVYSDVAIITIAKLMQQSLTSVISGTVNRKIMCCS